MLFDTIGTKGFFFFLVIFLLIVTGIYKAGIHSNIVLINLIEWVFVLIIFIGTTYPSLRRVLFKVGTQNNVDISDTGSNSFEEHHSLDDSHHDS